MDNNELINKTIDTTSLSTGGLLAPEQAQKFFDMTFEATPFSKLHRKELRTSKQGELDKIAIGGRLLRKKVENSDDNYRAGIATSKIVYSTVAVRLPWEITEESLRQNIEGENFEDHVINLMTQQVGIDLEDLHFNGDTTKSSDPFLSINDGWLAQLTGLSSTSHKVDCTSDTKFNKATLFKILMAMPNKYKASNLNWIMSPTRKEEWIEYLTSRATGAGDAALVGNGDVVSKPIGYQIVTVPSMPDTIILLADPQNFIAVNTYEIRIRKTVEGRDAVMEDKRFYAIHFDDDPVIQEQDAVSLATNLTATTLTD